MNDNGDYEEEEILCYVDFNCKVEDELFSSEKEFKIIGLENEAPILQLGNQVFKGEWMDTMGTHIFFEEDQNAVNADPLFTEMPPVMLQYTCKTNKRIHMSRVFVNPKITRNDDEKETEQVAGDVECEEVTDPMEH